MSVRLARSALLLAILVLLLVPLTGCHAGGQPASGPSTATAAVALALSPAGSGLSRSDPAVWAAVQFELAHCRWDWRQPQAAYVAMQRLYATAAYGAQLAGSADTGSWQNEVVAEHQVVTCTVTSAHRTIGAPSTATHVYVRMTASAQISSSQGDFTAGDASASWLVVLTSGHWLVSGPFEGG